MATLQWLGTAVAVKELYTITIGGTWIAGETATMTIAGKDLVVTIGTTVTTAQIAIEVAAAWNGATLGAGYGTNTPSGGASIPEFAQIAATASGSTVLLAHKAAGVPFALSVSETSASGTFSASNTTDATGPHHWDNVDNWDVGSVPVSSDTVLIDRPVSILYGIDQNSVTHTAMTITARFTRNAYIGLPLRNASGYDEYLEDELKIGCTTINCSAKSGRIKLNTGSAQTTLNVFSTGQTAEADRAAIQWRGTHASNVVNLYDGDFAAAQNLGETATIATFRQSGGTAYLSSGVSLTTVDKGAGSLVTNGTVGTITNDAGTLRHASGTITALNVNGGMIYLDGTGTITTANLDGCTVNLDGSVQGITITTLNSRGKVTIVDTNQRLSVGTQNRLSGALTYRGAAA